ncbi:Metal-dependent hydrolase of the TIM-barrel fold [Furfurilactobacillus rossiae]|uniref:amidohydrolase family protein n=1 Tax=Furfurilactobacillus rossiae TaxID=231049 RepID=UPI0015C082F3|nr:amidohydrolase family protein [Furfurilactobacillus rossiae]MCF6165563.1 amidohydrolase [Furfurilactobacillus rossiae]QLE63377.1 Metal-dependent hydrolase of the TIM-barrel fold [Furfurilactobacillus rossiae]
MNYSKIDIHSHYVTPGYTKFCQKQFHGLAGDVAEPKWQVTDTLSLMQREHIAYSVLSVSMPHIAYHQDAQATAALANEINTFGSQIHHNHIDKLGYFATVPLPFVNESIAIIKSALFYQQALGVVLPTSAQGIYLGDPHYDAIMQLLNDVGAVVLIHPNDPPKTPYHVDEKFPHPIYDFFAETTRTFLNLVQNRIFIRYPNIKFIIPHGGAALSVLAPRTLGAKMLNHRLQTDEVDVTAAMKHVYFDVAGRVLPSQLPALLQIVNSKQLLYASDYPYTPKPVVLGLNSALAHTHWLTDTQRQQLYFQNALRLLDLD